MTVEQIIAEGLTVHGTAAGKPHAKWWLRLWAKPGLIQRGWIAARTNFGGQRQRVAIASDDSAPQTGGAG
jgi:microcin C transport system ATP-binding protein